MQAQFEDGADLQFGKLIAVAGDVGFDRLDQFDIGRNLGNRPFARDQGGARFGGAGGTTNDAHHFVEIGDRDHKAKQQMRAFAGLVELELGAARDDLFAEADERLDDIAQVEHFGPSAADREHIGGEARLGGRVPPQAG